MKFMLFFGDRKAAKDILIKLVSKYQDSYIGHKMLAEIYEKEGGMRKAIDEYVAALEQAYNQKEKEFEAARDYRRGAVRSAGDGADRDRPVCPGPVLHADAVEQLLSKPFQDL